MDIPIQTPDKLQHWQYMQKPADFHYFSDNKTRIINYWAKLMKLPEYDILNKCVKIQMDLNANGKTNCSQNVANIIEN